MGWTVLYIAFGIVALWLLGEVLLQYKARLRWRLLAFAGFLGVVLGVLIPSVLVIVVGAIAFATGQTYVTLSFRRGFSTGWAIGGSPGESRRRRRAGGAESREPVLEVSGLEYEGASRQADPAAPAAVYATEPMPDDTGQYGVYTDHARTGGAGHQDQHGEQQPPYAAYDPYDGYGGQAPQDPYGGQGSYQDQGAYQGQGGYQDQGGHAAGQYDHGADRTDHGAYSDPYNGAGTTTGTGQYTPYDSYGNGYDPASYATGQQQPEDPYAGQYTDTPPGGVWVPQQRESDQYPPLPPEVPVQPAPYGNGYDTGQNEQYRY
ncbi:MULTISPECIES: hypothetical protein [unclassified Streptomyces]|uniref:hypothetical protein n=1 Tax=unclassified Streptomyces TaxID=2593676 RepID=UPI0011C7DBBA|nr:MULTISPECIES: hypothetical protein [unclassified Streptomyces]TXS08507.1 hypothetical protein EAO68_30620 [Streptomyces sp. wa22]WSQ87786.1 hypothetical protein OG722_27040 [Streptomyces sp. NBC_01212]WSR51187.1 hypothetical protein OG279_27670 [Streptomyces sp. NBC_01201]